MNRIEANFVLSTLNLLDKQQREFFRRLFNFIDEFQRERQVLLTKTDSETDTDIFEQLRNIGNTLDELTTSLKDDKVIDTNYYRNVFNDSKDLDVNAFIKEHKHQESFIEGTGLLIGKLSDEMNELLNIFDDDTSERFKYDDVAESGHQFSRLKDNYNHLVGVFELLDSILVNQNEEE